MLARLTRPLLRYGGTLVLVALAAAATNLLWAFMTTTVAILFVAAIMVSAWYGGLGPGLVATVLSAALIEYYFEEPYYTIELRLQDLVRDAVFLFVAVLVTSLESRRKRAEHRLREAHDLLERRVEQRTAEVERQEREARSMIEVGQAITSSLDRLAVLELIVDRACLLLGARRFALAAVEQKGGDTMIRFLARRGLSPAFLDHMRPVHGRDGTTPIAITERRTVWSADLLNDPAVALTPSTRRAVEIEGYRAVLSVPLLVNERAIGALVMYRDTVGPFSTAEIDLLQALAAQAAIALENARLFEGQQARATRLHALARLNQIVSSSLDTIEVLSAIANAAAELMEQPLVSIWIADEAAQTVELRAFSDEVFAADFPITRLRFGEGATGWVAAHRRPLHIPDVTAEDRVIGRSWWVQHGFSGSLLLPILFKESLLGVLVLLGRHPFAFGPDEQELLDSFVAQAAVAIRNARLYEEVRAAHERLARSQEQLIQSEKLAALGQLVAGIAHELNNPLAAVLGRAYLAERQCEGPVVKEHIQRMRESAERAADIVRNLLQFSRRASATLEAIDVNVLVERVILNAGAPRGVTVVRDLAPEMPSTWGDVTRLQQVLLNLVTNAYQAMGEKGGVLSIATSTRAGVIRIEVADTGPGVPPEIRTRIFDPFFTTRPVGKGTGLGLSVAHGIVSAHEGRIQLDQSAGPGARFVVELPVHTPPAAPLPPAEPRPPAGATILVVDDEPEIAQVLGALTEQLGARAVIALSAREARERLAADSFDLVTLDLIMPEESGADFWRSLARERPEVAGRVVFVTGNVDPTLQSFVEATGRPLLAKPYTLDALRQLLVRELGEARLSAPSGSPAS